MGGFGTELEHISCCVEFVWAVESQVEPAEVPASRVYWLSESFIYVRLNRAIENCLCEDAHLCGDRRASASPEYG